MQAFVPDPAAPGRVRQAAVEVPSARPDQALVEVAAFSPNRGETYLLEHPRPAWRPGKDIAGTVIEPAADGSGPPAGTRVVGHPEEGGWAEIAAAPTDRLAPLSDGVTLTQAAALPLAGLTALRLTRVAGSLASRSVLLTGASGGVGHYFVELAAAQGAQVTAVSAGGERGARLLELGAVRVVSDVRQVDGPFDVAIESVGGETTREAWHRLKAHGLLIWMGQAARKPLELDYLDWDGAMSVTIRKFNYLDSEVPVATDLATLARLTAAGRLHPEIGMQVDWARTGEALQALVGRRVRGNAVLTIGDRVEGTQEPAEVIRRYVEALNRHDREAVADSFAPEAVWRLDGPLPISGTFEGREAILNDFFGAAGTLLDPGSTHIEVTGLVAAGDEVALEWTSRARTRAGAPYDNRCMGLFTVRAGRITQVREYMDTDRAARLLLSTEAVEA